MKKQITKIIIIAFCILVAISVVRQLLTGGDGSDSSNQTASAQTESVLSDDNSNQSESGAIDPEDDRPIKDKYALEICTSAKMLIERFTKAYKITGAPQKWAILDFDENGAIMLNSQIENKNTGAIEDAMVVLTPIIENDKMTSATPHYIKVGGTVFGDDGYCDETFETMNEAYKLFNSEE